jgi:hypothetical protein
MRRVAVAGIYIDPGIGIDGVRSECTSSCAQVFAVPRLDELLIGTCSCVVSGTAKTRLGIMSFC